MPPRINSRHEFTYSIEDVTTGKRILTEREPYRFRNFNDNIVHVVGEGDSLFNLAGRYYKGFTDRPAGLWWVIADFQPDPILDPTLALDIGREIVIPSLRTIREEIFNPARRDLH